MTKPLEPGVALGQYRANQADVSLSCLDCQLHRTFPLEAVIERLQARGVGGEHTGIKEVADLVLEPCPRCGSLRFDSRPAFPSGKGSGPYA